MIENFREYVGNNRLRIIATVAGVLVAAGVYSSVVETHQNNPEHQANPAVVAEGIAGGGLSGSLAIGGIVLVGNMLGRRQEHEN